MLGLKTLWSALPPLLYFDIEEKFFFEGRSIEKFYQRLSWRNWKDALPNGRVQTFIRKDINRVEL